ncbi:MAG: prepilin-type N-terminal cleavage/methylation domain-containing protein [Polaromonas sp.]|uniref:GspH/FimT family pseudopilin n=1 Tax=Polaromonas sp. TaxID=1869339 RepID=UPI001830D94A|nr:GspH/FimT family protein [Polaromonas sp.]NMM09190.1 prepilin-type N-terminal cleavage/methylation domain-containing protein [Polaromonas sp.]
MDKRRGFTLIELLVVLAVVAVLATLAAPSFKRQIQSTTISSTVNTFLADMRYARSESIRRGGGVIMCHSNSPEAANPVCDNDSGPGGNGWISGWIVFQDLGGGGKALLRVQPPITSMDSIKEGDNLTTTTQFAFTATGRIPPSETSMIFGGSNYPSDVQRRVCINASGRPRISASVATCS